MGSHGSWGVFLDCVSVQACCKLERRLVERDQSLRILPSEQPSADLSRGDLESDQPRQTQTICDKLQEDPLAKDHSLAQLFDGLGQTVTADTTPRTEAEGHPTSARKRRVSIQESVEGATEVELVTRSSTRKSTGFAFQADVQAHIQRDSKNKKCCGVQ
mmetsp:Transcript_14622/g.32015  ORF Transcript_14622/g.32015 Transcript_14622/m.32015 type:complete len:159 (-) Transcript_14622:160-636(-)